MIFNETRLLDCVAYGSEFGQEFNTRIVTLRSGVERRNADWDAPLGRYSVRFQNLRPEDHRKVMAAHMACLGSLVAFRFKDWTDFEAFDEPIGVATGEAQTLQLIKSYAFGPLVLERRILKPINPIQVELGGIPSAVIVDYTTGTISFTAPEGTTVTWSGQFDVPVRFVSDRLDASPSARQSDGLILSSDVDLIEVRL